MFSTFLAGKDDLSSSLYLNMRSNLRTKEQVNALTFFTILGHEDVFNSDVARIVKDTLLTASIGFQGKRSELIALVMAQGRLANERNIPSGKEDFEIIKD